jgi:hypothetical protein
MERHIVSLTAMDENSKRQSATKDLGLLINQMKEKIATITSVVASDAMPDEPARASNASPKRK